jgi:hypothetical protein
VLHGFDSAWFWWCVRVCYYARLTLQDVLLLQVEPTHAPPKKHTLHGWCVVLSAWATTLCAAVFLLLPAVPLHFCSPRGVPHVASQAHTHTLTHTLTRTHTYPYHTRHTPHTTQSTTAEGVFALLCWVLERWCGVRYVFSYEADDGSTRAGLPPWSGTERALLMSTTGAS